MHSFLEGRKDYIRKARVAAEMKDRDGCVLFSGLMQCAAGNRQCG
jgi:hypothetical protein